MVRKVVLRRSEGRNHTTSFVSERRENKQRLGGGERLQSRTIPSGEFGGGSRGRTI